MAAWIPGRVLRLHAWSDNNFSLTIDCEPPAFSPGQFVRVGLDIDGERVARPYSCINTPDQPGLEILFNIVPDGPLTPHLARLREGDPIWISERANGFLTLDEVPASARDLWLVATGTGVGPFISILQSEEPWHRFERLILAYGVSDSANQTYTGLLDKLVQQHASRLQVLRCFSRESAPPAFHGRVTDALHSGTLEDLASRTIDAKHSHFLLCGNKSMIEEMSELLRERGLSKHLRRDPGQFSSEKYH